MMVRWSDDDRPWYWNNSADVQLWSDGTPMRPCDGKMCRCVKLRTFFEADARLGRAVRVLCGRFMQALGVK